MSRKIEGRKAQSFKSFPVALQMIGRWRKHGFPLFHRFLKEREESDRLSDTLAMGSRHVRRGNSQKVDLHETEECMVTSPAFVPTNYPKWSGRRGSPPKTHGIK